MKDYILPIGVPREIWVGDGPCWFIGEKQGRARFVHEQLVDKLIAALRPFANKPVDDDSMCHRGLVSKEQCGRCSEILAAREAISACGGLS